MHFLLIYYILINLIAFSLFGIDKRKAQKHKQRIREATLLTVAFAGGALGALIGMKIFHHKTKHIKFLICIPIFLCIHIGMLVYMIKGSL